MQNVDQEEQQHVGVEPKDSMSMGELVRGIDATSYINAYPTLICMTVCQTTSSFTCWLSGAAG